MRETRSPRCHSVWISAKHAVPHSLLETCNLLPHTTYTSSATHPAPPTLPAHSLPHTCSGSLLGLEAAAVRLILPPPMRGGVIIAAAPAGGVAALGATFRLPPSSPDPKVVIWLRLRGPPPPEEAELREVFRAESSATGRGPVRLCRLDKACGVRVAATLDLKAAEAEGTAVGGLAALVLMALPALGLLLVLPAAAAAEGVDRGWAETRRSRRSAAACSRSRARPGRVASCPGAGGWGKGRFSSRTGSHQGPIMGINIIIQIMFPVPGPPARW